MITAGNSERDGFCSAVETKYTKPRWMPRPASERSPSPVEGRAEVREVWPHLVQVRRVDDPSGRSVLSWVVVGTPDSASKSLNSRPSSVVKGISHAVSISVT